MPEHAHVLFVPLSGDYRVARLLQSLKQPVARRAIAFLREHEPQWLVHLRSGSGARHGFWQPGGGYDRNVNNARTAWAVVDYIHNSPVGRGLVERPKDWPWSSAR